MQKVDYEVKIKKVFGWEKPNIKYLKQAFGILKNAKKSPVRFQKELRREWEKRMHKG